MTINWITIKVNNLEKSKKFYRDFLEMKVEREFSVNNMDITFFSANNGTKIELIYDKNLQVKYLSNNNISIGICSSNYDEMLHNFKQKNMIFNGPLILGDNMECFFVNDPNGVAIQIIKQN